MVYMFFTATKQTSLQTCALHFQSLGVGSKTGLVVLMATLASFFRAPVSKLNAVFVKNLHYPGTKSVIKKVCVTSSIAHTSST